METIIARIYGPGSLILSKASDLTKVYNLIIKEENFIISWKEDGMSKSEVVIATQILAKVYTGNMILKSEEE